MSQAGDDGSGAGSLPAGLARELARANRLREALFEISNLTRTTFELDAFYADLHRIVSSLMYAENFVIAIRAPESGELRFEYYRDSVDTDLTPATINKRPQAEIENSLTGWVAREGKLRHLTPEEVLEIRASLGLKRIGSPAADWMGAPLRGREHIVGAVVVQSYDPAICYTEDDEQLLLFVCDHVTAQLEQRQADRALRRLNDELEARVQLRTRELEEQIEERRRGERLQRALFEITSLASEALTLKELYPRLHAVIGELIYARNMYIALADERRRLLEFVYYVDDVDDSTAPLDIPESKENVGPTLRVYFRGEPLLWLATESDLPAGARGSPSQAWLGVPLRAGERVIGALVVQSYDAGIVYGEADKRLLTFVAQHVGTTIERRRAKLAL
ncbi:MAG: GAF domain-containing protein, partial [Pseudomonadota bacterium]